MATHGDLGSRDTHHAGSRQPGHGRTGYLLQLHRVQTTDQSSHFSDLVKGHSSHCSFYSYVLEKPPDYGPRNTILSSDLYC